MTKKYKMTGCARIFIILIILGPLAYLGASYFNGEDGLSNIKSLFQSDDSPANDDRKKSTTDLQDQIDRLEKDVKFYTDEIRRLERELADCQNAGN